MTQAQMLYEKMLFEKYQRAINNGDRLEYVQNDEGGYYLDISMEYSWQGWLAAKQNAWISVEDHLPEDGEMVAVCYKDYGKMMCDKAKFYDVCEEDGVETPFFDVCKGNKWQIEEVIFWQPMPAEQE